MRPLQDWPLVVIGILLLVVLAGSMTLGHWLGRRIYRGQAPEGLGLVTSAVVSLLTLLTAFTFAASADRFNTRRRLVEQEANALESTYMSVLVLDQAPKGVLAPMILQYGKARQAFFEAPNRQSASEAERRSDLLRDTIWTRSLDSSRIPGSPNILGRVSELFEVDGVRRAEHDARVPIRVVQLLLLNAMVAVALIGMTLSGGKRHVVASLALLLVLTITACLILGLDRPWSADMLAQQTPMDRSLAFIQRWEAARLSQQPSSPVPNGSSAGGPTPNGRGD